MSLSKRCMADELKCSILSEIGLLLLLLLPIHNKPCHSALKIPRTYDRFIKSNQHFKLLYYTNRRVKNVMSWKACQQECQKDPKCCHWTLYGSKHPCKYTYTYISTIRNRDRGDVVRFIVSSVVFL